jgi:2Fe-2S ferredoxin
MPAVLFLPWNTLCEAEEGDTLLQVAVEHNLPLPHECGGDAACSTCAVEIVSGENLLSRMEDLERETLDKLLRDRRSELRLACQVLVERDGGRIEVRSLLGK